MSDEYPGQWVKFPVPQPMSIAAIIQAGGGYGATKGDYEARTVSITGSNPKRCHMYARYIGAES